MATITIDIPEQQVAALAAKAKGMTLDDWFRKAAEKIAIVVLGQQQWPQLRPYVQRVVEAVDAATPGSLTEVDVPRPPRPRYKPEQFQP